MTRLRGLQDAFRRDLLSRSHSHTHQIAWVLSSIISLLTARHLLVELNFHHPVLVFLAQLCMVAGVVILNAIWRHQERIAQRERPIKETYRQRQLKVFGAMSLTALSMLCYLQAVLHFGNLPTLIMLLTVAVSISDFLVSIFGHDTRTRTELLRCSVLVLTCAGILATEYRLSVNALITSIPAMIFTGIANALGRSAASHHKHDELPSLKERLVHLVVAGYVIVAGWLFFIWPDKKTIILNQKHGALLIVNAATTMMALCIGRSHLLPLFESNTVNQPENEKTNSESHMTWVILALVGIAGCHSTLSVRRSYTNWYQFCCFAVAMLCIARGGPQAESRTPTVQYELLDIPEVETDSSTEDDVSSRSDHPRMSRLVSKYRSGTIVIAILVLWLSYMYLNFSIGKQTTPSALDGAYKPVSPLEIVISMYKEPVEDVRGLMTALSTHPHTSGATVTIYIKDHESDTENIRLQTGADKVIRRPNVGREGETYLYHIINHWDELAQHTVFMQADIHNPRGFYPRLWSYFDPNRTGFLSLGWSGVCSCEECSDRFSWRDTTGLLPLYHNKIDKSSECTNLLLSYKGQFVVSAARIRGISKAIYSELWHAFVDEDGWAHKPGYLQGRPDSMSAPDFGYTMERMWNVLFQCSNMDVAWKCPTLLSGWRLGGDTEDCQCFDSKPEDLG